MAKWTEIGTTGMSAVSGYIMEAYNAKLYWPGVYDDYNRIRRSDPEIGGIVRPAFVGLVRQIELDWMLPDDANDAEKDAQEFGREVLADMEGGQGSFLEEIVSHVPFLGWGWWVPVLGLRRDGWRPPGGDPWRSQFDDQRVGIRRLAWRDHSSFEKWEMDDATGRMFGMWQVDPPNQSVMLPLEDSLHLTFGDPNNPEGLAPLEAIWRLERYKYALELVQGIGYEHAAGHVKWTVDGTPTDNDKAIIKKAARSLLSAQEGNYIMDTDRVKATLMDVPFSAATDILEAIRYYGLLKLQVFNAQWRAIATTAGTGAYSAASVGEGSALADFNGMMSGFAAQMDAQLGPRLFGKWNPGAFPGMERRPVLVATPIEAAIPLDQLGAFVVAISPFIVFDDDDILAIRRKSNFLPDVIQESGGEDDEPEPEPEEETDEIGLSDVMEASRRFLERTKETDPAFANLMLDELRAGEGEEE